ncbi:MAG: PEP-CTERM sorting domain-containing protein [Phycisphaerales bacterium]|nr:PEP-CTERM sorting domain-containing protein [Phycisphaerales bacterium]
MKKTITSAGIVALMSASAFADISVSTYDDLTEGSMGSGDLYYNGVTYTALNSVDGVFPDGNTFVAGGDGFESLGNEYIVERATYFFDEFPGFGSRNNVLTFGRAFIPGDNLTIGPLSTLTMMLDSVADSASVDLGYFENGPWGGMVLHFEAFMNGVVVDADTLTISNLGGRDNGAVATLMVGGAEFDSLQLYATLGNDFTAPRILMDNLTVNSVPAPGSLALLLGATGLMSRRRR